QAVPATPRSEPAGAPQRELAAQTYLPAAPHAAARLHADQARMRIMPAPMPVIQEDRENYAGYQDNPVQLAQEQPVSTFGLDVDTGSYSNVRRLLNDGRLPPADAVRAEAFINYFDYG
ncbi:von Willebrand factor type A domain-containing protein, partial [Bordetella pertussis]